MTENEREKKILDHIGLVKHLAKRYKIMGDAIEFDDLVHDGIVGLIHAVDDYDPKKGMSFISYASSRIVWMFIETLRKHGGNFSIGMRLFKFIRLCATFKMLYGRELTHEEFNSLINKIGEISKTTALNVYNGFYRHKNNANMNDNNFYKVDCLDQIKDDKNEIQEYMCMNKIRMRKALRCLNSQERKIIIYYYGLKDVAMNIREISCVIGLSVSRVGGVKKEAELKLRKILDSYGAKNGKI